jgi:energy-coupling factor transporter ATP-binding protein EcfA2
MALQNPELQFGAGLVKDHDPDPPERFGLREHLDKSPFELSLGQQRRLSLSMLGDDRPLLLLDEPFYGQDRDNTRMLMDIIRRRAERGTAVLLVCHDPDISQAIADELLIWDGLELRREERRPFLPWWEEA